MPKSKYKRLFFLLPLLLLLFSYRPTHGQNSTIERDTVDKKKLRKYIIASTVAYGGALVGLNEIWYSDHEKESFHFFNDNSEWKQMDKIGHFYNAFQIGHVGIKALQDTGLSKQKAYLWGGLLGFIVLTPIEVLDGYSAEYGASWGDIIANFSGSALLMSQYFLWDEVRIYTKYAFHPDKIADKRPGLLGDGLHEELIKNYNGMSFWLSFDLYSLTGKNEGFPKWLNVAVGYGVAQMISANDASSQALGYDPYRQYYLSVDFDFSHIKTKSKFLNTMLFLGNMVHLPAPALEYNRKKGFKFHPLYF